MKIIRHQPRRRPLGPPIPEGQSTQRPTQKKALLIGINYEHSKNGPPQKKGSDIKGDELRLTDPHRDVADMKKLLTGYYNYNEKDIVVMIDDKKPADHPLLPSRSNMLREIQKLVQDAQSGDRFFFHFSGHTTQTENRNHSEEDDMDEWLIPSEGEHIRDNDLRRLLVEALPIGSQLVAIFDSCHSETLLDLDHTKCNRVYVPWISKGKRQSDPQRNNNVRRLAMAVSRRIYQNKRSSAGRVKSRRTSIDITDPLTNQRRMSIKTRSLSIKSNFEKWYDDENSPIQRCDSPTAMFPCTGFCKPAESGEADVISLSSCKDSQISWEDPSMTQVLVEILKKSPHPPLKEMMVTLSHQLHKLALVMHTDTRVYKKRLKAFYAKKGQTVPVDGSPPLEMDNFQDPQLASHTRLNMDRPWNP